MQKVTLCLTPSVVKCEECLHTLQENSFLPGKNLDQIPNNIIQLDFTGGQGHRINHIHKATQNHAKFAQKQHRLNSCIVLTIQLYYALSRKVDKKQRY